MTENVKISKEELLRLSNSLAIGDRLVKIASRFYRERSFLEPAGEIASDTVSKQNDEIFTAFEILFRITIFKIANIIENDLSKLDKIQLEKDLKKAFGLENYIPLPNDPY